MSHPMACGPCVSSEVLDSSAHPVAVAHGFSNGAPASFSRNARVPAETRRIGSFHFSTLEHPRREQFDAWNASFASVVEMAELGGGSAGFAGQQMLWDLGSLVFCRIKADAVSFASLAGSKKRDPIDHWVITVVLEGELSMFTTGGSVAGSAGSVQVHSLGKEYEGRSTKSEMLLLFIPREFFRGLAHILEGEEFTSRSSGLARLLGDYLLSLIRNLHALDVADIPQLVAATRAMILACLAPTSDRLSEAGDPIANVLLERCRTFVQTNIASRDLDARIVQRELGLSRSRLYRLFEPYGGVAHYIQRRRLLNAHAALADPGDTRPIVQIAEEYGFADGSDFSRAFRRAFGYCPRDVRAAAKGSIPAPPIIDLEGVDPARRLGALLRRL